MGLATLLVPLDGSELAERALPLAQSLAQAHGATLVLVRAAEAHVPPGVDPSEQQLAEVHEAQAYLDHVAAQLTLPAERMELAVPYGKTAESILLEIQLHHADLVIMSTHGRGGLSRLVLGSVAAAVLEASPAPLLLLRGDSAKPMSMGHAVIGLDGSPLAHSIVPAVRLLLDPGRAKVTLVRALDTTPARVTSGGDRESNPTPAELDAATHDLAASRAELEEVGVEVGTRISRGRPASVLLDAAREQHADLIAIATHGMSGLGPLLMGSVAEEVIRTAELPVLVHRPGATGIQIIPKVPKLPFI